MTSKTVYMYNSTFHLKEVPNDFDPLAKVIRVEEEEVPNNRQTLFHIDRSSLKALGDAIHIYLQLEKKLQYPISSENING